MSILKPNQSYTFSDYGKMPYEPEDILAELGCSLVREDLPLPMQKGDIDMVGLERLQQQLTRNLSRVSLTTETSRREALIAPTLFEVCEQVDSPLKVEYTMNVSDRLKGSADYFIPGAPGTTGLLIIEAKQADLARGFTQLAAELIALDQWIQHPAPTFYGAVTTGDLWKFGAFRRSQRQIVEDRHLWQLPGQLEIIMRILIGVISAEA